MATFNKLLNMAADTMATMKQTLSLMVIKIICLNNIKIRQILYFKNFLFSQQAERNAEKRQRGKRGGQNRPRYSRLQSNVC